VLTVPAGQRGRLIIEPDRAAAIGLAIAGAGKGDIVVVAGKGHERGQYVAGAVIPFDDREVAAAALAGLASTGPDSSGPDSTGPAEPPIEQSLIEQGLIRSRGPGRQEDA
jgi:UDP-N-acetylmuramoyl-L-alanyl-D-glutamate--2,6-diaminopimelate ligase